MIDWNQIDLLFLDLDGTLLDLHFDNHFWLEHVPNRYAATKGLTLGAAKRELYARYKEIEGTLEWYCVDYWSRELGLDIALLKEEVGTLIAVHPHVVEFLDAVRGLGRRVVLVTNAHHKSLMLKLDRTRLGRHLDRVICSHDLGLPKEDPDFWTHLHQIEPFDRDRTLFVDDSAAVLRSARAYGIRWLFRVVRPDTQGPLRQGEGFSAIRGFSEILPDALTYPRS
ncbi:MAG: GMP/IMP nucleotidase [Gammaproteobacteria bacterium]|nr:GMP/IMP nucleotidase [Gammaproteobacteria bacterium]